MFGTYSAVWKLRKFFSHFLSKFRESNGLLLASCLPNSWFHEYFFSAVKENFRNFLSIIFGKNFVVVRFLHLYPKSTNLPPVTQLFSVMPRPIGLRIGMGVLWCLTQVLTWPPFFYYLPLSSYIGVLQAGTKVSGCRTLKVLSKRRPEAVEGSEY